MEIFFLLFLVVLGFLFTFVLIMYNIRTYDTEQSEQKTFHLQYADSSDYLLGGSLVMKNGRIDKYQFEEGYCQAKRYNNTMDDFTFCYYDKDHLGDIRQVTEADGSKKGTIIQKMNYYPFGAEFCDASADSLVQPYKYNGKELDLMYGLNTYDYGARQHDPILARWDRIDPLCEKYYSTSPYAYCGNNPVIFIDPNGKQRNPIVKQYKGQKWRPSFNYGRKRKNRKGKTYTHKGEDINIGAGADDRGAPVLATHYGRVRVKSYKDGNPAGNRIWVDYTCSDGTVISTGYFHLGAFSVKDGQIVNEGDKIGEVGNSANGVEQYDSEKDSNTHLHYEVKVNGQNVSPEEDGQEDYLIDPQQIIKEQNTPKDVVITPTPQETPSEELSQSDQQKL